MKCIFPEDLYHNLAVAEGQVRLLVKIRNGRIFLVNKLLGKCARLSYIRNTCIFNFRWFSDNTSACVLFWLKQTQQTMNVACILLCLYLTMFFLSGILIIAQRLFGLRVSNLRFFPIKLSVQHCTLACYCFLWFSVWTT